MRKIKYSILILVTLFVTNACGDFLDIIPDNLATIDHAFSNQTNAEKYLYTCYSYMPTPHAFAQSPALNAGDEVFYIEQHRNLPGPSIVRGEQNVNNPRFNYWSRGGRSLYSGIRQCNIFLNKIDEAPGVEAYSKVLWKAEAKFLKAYYYFYLARMYGPVVIREEVVDASQQEEEFNKERSTLDETFTHIVNLLDEAMEDLPMELQAKELDFGRATKPIAAALKARVLMEYASPLFNGNPIYMGVTDGNGKKLFPQQYDREKWERAAEACKEAIDLCHQVGHRLFDVQDYSTPFVLGDFITRKAVLRSRITEKINYELIWGSTRSSLSIQNISMLKPFSTKVNNKLWSYHAPTMRVAEMYYSKNGVPIEEDLSYPYTDRYNLRQADDSEKFMVQPNQKTVQMHFDREPRFYSDIAFDRGHWFGAGVYKEGVEQNYIHFRKGEYSREGEVSRQSATGYLPKKLIALKSTIDGSSQTFKGIDYSFPIIRLADLYLYYAEALNEMKAAPDGQVYEWIDKVRNRAGLEGVVDSWSKYSNKPDKPTTKDGMRSIIQHERLIELAFEGARFWDLRRWKRSYEFMNRPIKGWNVTKSSAQDYYKIIYLYSPRFSEKDYLWPIKESELDIKPKLKQNLGW